MEVIRAALTLINHLDVSQTLEKEVLEQTPITSIVCVYEVKPPSSSMNPQKIR